MATEAFPVINGQSDANGVNGDLSAAQKLMLKHDETHTAFVEDVPDEEDLKHGEMPKSSSVLESADEPASAPTWAQPVSAKAAGKQKAQEPPIAPSIPSLDTESHELFPALGGGIKPQKPSAQPKAKPSWAPKDRAAANGLNGTTPTNGTPIASSPTSGTATPAPAAPAELPAARTMPGMAIPGRHTERISLAPSQIIPRAQMRKPLPDVIKDINKRSKANVTMSTGNGGLLWFNATGPEIAARQALKDIVEQVGARVSTKVSIPRSARAHIIGKQGSTIKALQEKSGARIQMPKVDDTNGAADDDDDDATIDVLIEGNALSAEMARADVVKIAGERAATVNNKLRGIPAEYYPFIAGPHNARISEMEQGRNLRVNVPTQPSWNPQSLSQLPADGTPAIFQPAPPERHISLSGDRQAVQEAKAEIERLAEELRRQITLKQMAIQKGRQQFIVGDNGVPLQQFLEDTGCSIILPEDPEDETVTIIGPQDKVQNAVDRAVELASTMHGANIDISRQHRNAPGGANLHAQNITRYLQQRKEIERLERQHNTHIYTPFLSDGIAPWELYAKEGRFNIHAQSEIASIVNGHPPSRMANLDVDPFFHQHLQREIVPKLQQDFGIYTVIPTDTDSEVPLLLVFEGPEGVEPDYQVPHTHPSPAEVQNFQRSLDEARKYILDIIGSQEQLTTESIDVPPKFHERLRRFIKKEQESRVPDQIPVRVSANSSIVTLRGPSSAVKALANKINAYVEQEKADEKERDFTMSFDFPQKHANQLIGKGGSNIRELRDKFDVEIQVDNGKVELKGPKAKSEAAKAHITSLGRQWADETTHILKIEPKYHRELIGSQGNQINKLQTRYKVQIHFPRGAKPIKDDQSVDGAASEAASPRGGRRNQAEDEVIIRGPSRGADEARDEILSLLQYLKDNSYSATVSVQQSQIPSLIGQGGKAMDELRQLTGARIDVPGSRDAKDPSGLVEIQIKGAKTQVAQAKKIIEDKKNVFDKTVSKTLEVDKKHHRSLIGTGGSTLRDIVSKAGGTDDRRTVQFPRSDSDGNLIRIEGTEDVVNKIIAAMQEIVAQRDSQVTEIVEVPTEKHRSLIGRGGETKRDLESKLGVSIDIPRQGSGQTGVKIIGQPNEVAKAKRHIADLIKGEQGETVQIPRQFHHAISDNGQFFRRLRNDHQVTVDHAGHKVPSKPAAPSARASSGALPLITDDQDPAPDTHSWNIVNLASSSGDLEGDIPWILRGPPDNIAKAKASLVAALQQAQRNTTTGYLVLPDPKTYRYVIGQGGSKVNSIRKATGCKINVPRDQARDEAIEIQGSEEGVEKARDLILEAVREGLANSNGAGRNQH